MRFVDAILDFTEKTKKKKQHTNTNSRKTPYLFKVFIIIKNTEIRQFLF